MHGPLEVGHKYPKAPHLVTYIFIDDSGQWEDLELAFLWSGTNMACWSSRRTQFSETKKDSIANPYRKVKLNDEVIEVCLRSMSHIHLIQIVEQSITIDVTLKAIHSTQE